MANIFLLGLPGLYQNWLMAAVDPTSVFQLHGTKNFFCSKSIVKWQVKVSLEDYSFIGAGDTVINLLVHENNIPWYLYNLFEKTYDIKVQIDNFYIDLQNKASKFTLFAEFKKELEHYHVHTHDQLVHYFYKMFVDKTNFLYKYVSLYDNKFINIEYDNFTQPILLKNKLSVVPNFNSEHFDNLYKILLERNQRYLNRKQDFLSKLKNKQELDVVELGYVGKLVHDMYNKDLDWSSSALRSSILKHKNLEILQYAQNNCHV